MFLVDMNVLIYSADPESELHRPCRRRLEIWRAQSSPWHVLEYLPQISPPLHASARFPATIDGSAGMAIP
jgi:hypothetical protein